MELLQLIKANPQPALALAWLLAWSAMMLFEFFEKRKSASNTQERNAS